MTMYGLYIRDLDEGDLVWFTTDRSLAPGAYKRGRLHGRSPDVYVAESIPALVLQVGPPIQQVEDRAQSSLSTADMPSNAQRRVETEMSDGLLQRLTETSSIWVSNPHWVDHLRPVPASSG